MATIKGPRGAMKQALVTSYNVGDSVILTTDEYLHGCERVPAVGSTGVIRRIGISDPDDGDDKYLTFSVKFACCTLLLGDNEITPATEANAWLLNQLSALKADKESAR